MSKLKWSEAGWLYVAIVDFLLAVGEGFLLNSPGWAAFMAGLAIWAMYDYKTGKTAPFCRKKSQKLVDKVDKEG